jgi:hypothetical protein
LQGSQALDRGSCPLLYSGGSLRLRTKEMIPAGEPDQRTHSLHTIQRYSVTMALISPSPSGWVLDQLPPSLVSFPLISNVSACHGYPICHQHCTWSV